MADGLTFAWRSSVFAGLRASEAELLQQTGSGAALAAGALLVPRPSFRVFPCFSRGGRSCAPRRAALLSSRSDARASVFETRLAQLFVLTAALWCARDRHANV